MITLFWFGVCVAMAYLLTGKFMEDCVGQVAMAYCPEMLAENQPPMKMVHLTDELAAVFERPWWEGGPAPR